MSLSGDADDGAVDRHQLTRPRSPDPARTMNRQLVPNRVEKAMVTVPAVSSVSAASAMFMYLRVEALANSSSDARREPNDSRAPAESEKAFDTAGAAYT